MTITCPNCKTEEIRKRGFRHNKVGKKQKYLCSKCGNWFVEDDGFKRMRHSPKIIVRAVHMHNDGMSLFQIKNHLWQYDGVKVSKEAIRKWCKKFGIFLKSDKRKSKSQTKRKTAS